MLFWLVKFLQLEPLQVFNSILIAITCLNTSIIETESHSEPSKINRMELFANDQNDRFAQNDQSEMFECERASEKH